ncbi:MAG: hypothetical protein JSS20_19570 [Proteobacteria bacterium]|nr:hypothetical protein [Pseudomonadota bacterium]
MSSDKLDKVPGASRILPPPKSGERAKRALNSYGAGRGEDGRISRKTGRDKQFATIVTPEFHAWIKAEAKNQKKRMCVLLEDMRAAYEKVHGGTR